MLPAFVWQLSTSWVCLLASKLTSMHMWCVRSVLCNLPVEVRGQLCGIHFHLSKSFRSTCRFTQAPLSTESTHWPWPNLSWLCTWSYPCWKTGHQILLHVPSIMPLLFVSLRCSREPQLAARMVPLGWVKWKTAPIAYVFEHLQLVAVWIWNF